MVGILKFVSVAFFGFILLDPSASQAQSNQNPDANTRRAAECLRTVPGLIEGNSPVDVSNHNAHFAVYLRRRGKLGIQITTIRLHKGIRLGRFPDIDSSRVAACMRGMRRNPKP